MRCGGQRCRCDRFHAHIAPTSTKNGTSANTACLSAFFGVSARGRHTAIDENQEDEEQQRPFGPRERSKSDESGAQRQMPRSMRATKGQELPKRESGHRGEESIAAVSEQLDDNRRDGDKGHHDERAGQGGKLARDRKAGNP